MTIKNDDHLEREFEHLDWLYSGMESLLNGSRDQFKAMTGNESYYALHYDANSYAGNENKFTDGIKKAAAALYESISNMLKRINEYFFGDSQKTADEAAEKASDAITALGEMDGNAPVPEDSPARNPEGIMKSLSGGVDFNEIKEKNPELASAIDAISNAAQKVKDCDTIAKLRTVYNEIGSSASKAMGTVSSSLRTTLSAANTAANKLRSPKIPNEDDPAEVKNGIKEENQEIANEAKDETKKARIIGGVRNKIVGALNSISTLSKGIKDTPAKSDFKG